MSEYRKHRIQHKANPFYTKLQADTGYPQDILHPRCNREQKDFISCNKKNLKKLFKDCIAPSPPILPPTPQAISPNKMYEMKKLQYAQKNHTTIDFTPSLHTDTALSHTIPCHSFTLHDKTIELREKFNSSASKSQYCKDNHQRGTISHIEKRTHLTKKHAYNDVFGPDLSSLSVTFDLYTQKYNKQSQVSKSKALQSVPDKRKELAKLIDKLEKYNHYHKDSNKCTNAPQQVQAITHQKEILDCIRSITKVYKQDAVNKHREIITKIQDIKQINEQFFQQMVRHKQKRLQVRRNMFSNRYSTPQTPPPNPQDSFNLSILSAMDVPNTTHQDTTYPQPLLRKRMNAKGRFQKLKNILVMWATMVQIHGVERRYIFEAYKLRSIAYEKEGSYAYFKAIKNGDLVAVKCFVEHSLDYLYAIEAEKMSSLAFACFHNQTEVALYFLTHSINPDQECRQSHTPLHYALEHRNTTLVAAILRNGALPWSSHSNRYKRTLAHIQDKALSNLFNNARKVMLGVSMQRNIHLANQYWKDKRQYIVPTSRFTFREINGE